MFLLATPVGSPTASSSQNNITPIVVPINTGVNTVIDTVNTTTDPSAKWIVTVTDGTKTRLLELAAVVSNGNIFSNTFGIIGEYLNFSWDFILTGNHLSLQFTNHEVHQLTISAVRIQGST